MLYTTTPPAAQADRIYLFPGVAAARAAGGASGSLHAVAVRFEELSRRIVAEALDLDRIEPTWSTPAEARADGSVIAKGPIPACLFVPLHDALDGADPGAVLDADDRTSCLPLARSGAPNGSRGPAARALIASGE